MAQIYENYSTGGSSGRPDYQIGPSQGSMQLLNRLARQPSRDLPSAIAQIGAAFIQAHGKKKKAETARMKQEERALKRSGWADALGAGETLRGLAANDPTILGDQDFIKFWTSTRPEKGYEDILDDQGRATAQRGPDGRVVAHPLAPKAPAPADTKEDAQGYLRYFGGEQHGERVYPEAQTPAAEPKISPTVAAYEQLLERGHLEPGTTYADFRGLGAARNTYNAPAPTPEKGYENIYDEAGRLTSQQLIPGSGAARDIAAEQAKAEAKARGEAQRGGIVSAHADAIRKMVGDGGWMTTGLGGSILQDLPGSTAHDVQQRLATLKALTGFEELNRMRAASPTGGALGQVSERELGFLQSVVGSLEQSQSRGQFLENLARVESAFAQIVHGAATPQPQAQPPGVAALATALTGPSTPAPAPDPPPAYTAAGVGLAPASSNPQQRVQDYATLPPDALKRQVQTMAERLAENPGAYPQAEIDAAKRAYDRAFPNE